MSAGGRLVASRDRGGWRWLWETAKLARGAGTQCFVRASGGRRRVATAAMAAMAAMVAMGGRGGETGGGDGVGWWYVAGRDGRTCSGRW